MTSTIRDQVNQRFNSEQTKEIDSRRSQSSMKTMIQQIHDMMIEINHKLNDHEQRLQVLKTEQSSNSSSVSLISLIVESSSLTPSSDESINQSRWRPEKIDYFDSNTRDVAEFIDRIRDIVLLREQRLIATNLIILLQDQVKRWYNYELNSIIKMAMQQESIDEWIQTLLTRFTLIKIETLRQLKRQKYTRHDAESRKNSVDFLHEILRLTRLLDYSESKDLIMTYLRLKKTLQMQLSPSNEISTVSQMMMLFNIKKNVWYEMYRNFTRSSDSSTSYFFNYRQRSSLSSSSQQNIYQKSSSSNQSRSQRQITYSQQSHRAEAYFVNDKDDEWEYDSMIDTYFLADQSSHSPEHTSRAQGNTHDEDGDETYVNWAKMISDHRCNHQNCTHYHEE